MKIPKDMEKLLQKRAEAAMEFMDADGKIY